MSQLQGTSLLSINEKKILVPTKTTTPQPLKCPCSCSELGPMPPQIPGKTWVPAWTLRDNKRFGELVLDKMKGPTEKPPVKRINMDTRDKTNTRKRNTEKIYIHKATEKKR